MLPVISKAGTPRQSLLTKPPLKRHHESMLSCTVRLEFNAAKRLLEHEGKCRFLHGYRYALEATFTGPKGKAGMVVDFYEAKAKLSAWVEKHWEHNVILSAKDKALGSAISKITGQKIFYLEGDPSAEAMAAHLKEVVCPQIFGKSLRCTGIRLYDTPDAWVDVRD
jgi:6-pyruvoyltetrahydropterin/6-carboxytetrahydropterin synthase